MSHHDMLSFKVPGAHAPIFVSHTLGSSMSYQVLARKWRPATFEQMVGQSHVLHALTNALSQQRLHHAYLFTGTRGVGKTSLARLFAKGLNCEQGVTATPCGVCGSCVEIAQGRFVDLIEVDAASRTKVDDTRELLDNVQYRPTRGRFKVYLIDEVHMLSRSSFNALLKTLEEPPEHVKFLLATTDPQKLPVTVLSRCLQFNLKSLTQDEIGTQLNHILTQELLPFEVEALKLLAKAANGSMRDALSLTDQAIAFGGGSVMLNQVQTMLGSIDEQHVVALLKALTDADIGVLMQTCAQVLAYGADAQEVLRSLLELLHQITLTQFAPACAQQSLYSAQIRAFADQLTPEQVQLYYQILLTGRKDLPHAPDPKSGLEMALLRAVAFVPEKPVKRWQPDSPAEVSLPVGQTSPSVAALATSAVEKKTLLVEQTTETQPHAVVEMTVPLDIPATKPTLIAETHHAGKQSAQSAESALVTQDDALEEKSLSEDEDAADSALVAEQTLIISQALSQGYEPSVSIEPTSIEIPLAAASQSEDSKVETPLSANEHSVASTTDSNTELDYAYGQYGDYTQDLAPLDVYQDNYANFSSESYGSLIQEAVAEQATISPATQTSTQVENTTGVSIPASAGVTADPSLGQTSFKQTATASLEDDDILSAVLAARESLLSDLDALSAKDGDEKKSSRDLKLKGPAIGHLSADGLHSTTSAKALSAASQPAEPAELLDSGTVDSGSVDSEFEIDFDDDFDADLQLDLNSGFAQSAAHANKNPQTVQPLAQKNQEPSVAETVIAPDPNDRPPWEAAPATIFRIDVQHPTPSEPVSALVQVDEMVKGTLPQDELVHVEQMSNTPVQLASGPIMATAKAGLTTPIKTASNETGLSVAQPVSGNPLDLHWYKLMASLDIGGRVRQLAVNSVCQAQSDPLPLLLKPDQKHLAADVAIVQLEQALTAALGNPRRVQVVIGSDPKRETPLELRKRFHQELLQQAQQSLIKDDNVQWLIQRLGAELDTDTLVYPPDLLNQRSQQIQALPEPV
ncbi:DNA polymerase III subunit gamma/tau [Shewanella profunda]|uniref:DNA polymerase III subunit gamma/tau n=1 Tax=Shewanella profunda TaxID=254793 RepID=UPI00200F16DC|nr:DNA polymerase III subunit gamma/tau [Shewanella profunda]MCL1091308.1 DNA polymerase III subunit gamma/tau [Shewanella profunda]